MTDEEMYQDAALRIATDRRNAELNDIRLLLRNDAGLRFIRRLLDEGGVFHTTFTGDPLTSAFREGHRNFALKLFDDIIIAAPEKIVKILEPAEKTPEQDEV